MVERIRTLLEIRQLTPTQFADAIGIARPIVSHILSGRNKPSLEVVQRILAAMPDLSMPWLLNGTGPMLAGTSQSATVAQAPVHAVAAPTAPEVVEPVSQPQENANQQIAAPAAPAAPSTPPSAARNRRQASSTNSISPPTRPTAANQPVLKRFPAKSFKSGPSPAPSLAPAAADAVSEPASEAAAETLAPATSPVQPAAAVAPVGTTAASTSPTPSPAGGDSAAAALIAGAEKPIRRIVIFYRDGSFADYRPE
ncbi:helix-turn-helix domain-containing protein [Hymenobacter sp. B1770]|uniref:helix-turn-helix domain-containing protein n=1 Tax=Hymenobacter sp. B1770 TaxID=1718788 RepID=UPI003CE99C25